MGVRGTVDALREWAYKLAGRDKVSFIEAFVKIEDKDASELIVPFLLWSEQKKLINELEQNKLNVILKARQLGISWLVLSYAACELISHEGSAVIGLSRTEEEAKELVRRLGVIFSNMQGLFFDDRHRRRGTAYFTQKALELEIYWPSGRVSRFKAFPSAQSAARSFTANLIIFDEWAFQQFAAKIWTAGFPTINRPTGGRVIGLSTIERGSFFEETFCGAPQNGFKAYFLPWSADPRRDSEWYEQTRRALGDLIMQEYPASISEALTVPGGAYFPEVKRDIHIRELPEPELIRRYVCIDYGLDMLSAHWIWLDEHGHAHVYRELDVPNLTIGEAANAILMRSGRERITAYLAPPDLWNRSQESGKSRFDIFAEHGLTLIKTSNDLAAGCSAIKEWLRPDGSCGAHLSIDENAAPNLYRCLSKIQKDEKRADIYAKQPHDLTHDVDSLRCFAVYWTAQPVGIRKKRRLDFEFQKKENEFGVGDVVSEGYINY